MRFGMRHPRPMSSLKARTVGKYKRRMKRAVNPWYGRKGMGWVRNPRKALYNKVYHKTTFSFWDLFR